MQTELRSDLATDSVLWVHVTASTDAEARGIARTLVEEGLAACANILPSHTAIYRWQGKIVEDEEHAFLAKTTVARLPGFRDRVRDLHSSDLPCIVALPAAGGDAAFLDWVRAETRGR